MIIGGIGGMSSRGDGGLTTGVFNVAGDVTWPTRGRGDATIYLPSMVVRPCNISLMTWVWGLGIGDCGIDDCGLGTDDC